MPQTNPEIYHASLKHYGYGYGLFQPETTQKLRPGQCGYIDESGRWQPLLDLTDNELLVAAGYTPIDPLQRSDPDYQTWDPRVASTVKGVEVKIEGEASALTAGLPIDASVAMKYSTSANFGAILMCDDKVVVECYDLKDPFRDWLNQNASKLLAKYPTLKERGLYVATTTYSSSDIHINVWHNSQDEITLGFKAGVTGIGGLGPSVHWMRGRTTHGCSHFVTVSCPSTSLFPWLLNHVLGNWTKGHVFRWCK